MAVLTSDRDEAEEALETRVRELLATGMSADRVASTLRRSGAGSDPDALWLYSWVIGEHRRAGLRPRARLSSLE